MAAHSRSFRPPVALATCAELPHGDPDESRLLVAALEEAGLDASWRVWDAAGTEWAEYDAVVVRSTWDYQFRREEFLRWAAAVPALLNPFDVLVWNTDKRYLAELARDGIAVIETDFLEPGGPVSLPAEGEIVVKPSISAGSKDTARFAVGERSERARAERLIADIHAGGRTAMLQPYLGAVDELGETALVYLDGALSHAVRKGPLLRPGAGPTEDFFAAETIAPREPSEAERALGGRVLEAVTGRFGPLLYARVDVVLGEDEEPVVLEVELTEPSLFFGQADGAMRRFAAALRGRIRC